MREYRDVHISKLKWDALLVFSAAITVSALVLALMAR
jgi:hypothetical protein